MEWDTIVKKILVNLKKFPNDSLSFLKEYEKIFKNHHGHYD